MEAPEGDPSESHRLELLYVKALFLEKRHRECIVACRNILQDHQDDDAQDGRHPLRSTFMKFYLALSHDELARAMHSLSQAKIPAFDQANDLYDEAIATLPTAEECIAYLEKDVGKDVGKDDSEDGMDEEFDDDLNQGDVEDDGEASDQASPLKFTPSSRHDSVRSMRTAEKTRPWSSLHSAPLSPPAHNIRHSSPPVRSPPMSISGTTTSESDDLESHDSYNEIMMPNRMPPPQRLERDYSSMSLIAPAQKQLPHTALMRPIRMGSPAKPYGLPEGISTNNLTSLHRSRLPRLDTSPNTTSPTRKRLLTESEQASPIDGIDSPVSPLLIPQEGEESDSIVSDFSPISPVSPEGGWHPLIPTARDRELQSLHRTFQTHIQALLTQLQSHQALLRTAKLKARSAQLDHTLAQQSAAHKAQHSRSGSGQLRPFILQSQQPWTKTPEAARRAQKEARIQDGRVREWRRERFDPERYWLLADAALGEL